MAFLGLLAGFGIGELLGATPLQNQIEYSLNSLFPNKILMGNDVVDLYRRGHISKTLYYELMRYQGYDEKQARLYFRAQDSLLTAEQAFTKRVHDDLQATYDFENNTLTKPQLDARRIELLRQYQRNMFAQGYVDTEADKFFDANRPLPSFSTILEWMAKEVFEPDAIATFGLDREQPTELAHFMAKYGVPPEEARKYWIAHWNPIGYGAWRNMYARLRDNRTDIDVDSIRSYGIDPTTVRMSQNDFNEYFKVLEIAPYLRDRMIATANDELPFTVLQQAYQYGLLTDTQLLGKLKDYRYSDTDAQIILNTWRRKFPFKARESLANNILLQQRRGLMTKAQARAALISQGVAADIAAYQTNIVDEDIEQMRIKWRVGNLAIRLGRGVITDAEMSTAVDGFITDTERRDFEKENIRIRAQRYFKRVTPRQVAYGVSQGTLTVTEARSALATLNMPTSDIDLLLRIYANTATDGDGS